MPSRPTLIPLACLAAALAVLAATEVALRACGFAYPRDARRQVLWNAERDLELRRDDGLHQFDAAVLWRPRPNARVPWTTQERINADGFRGPLLAPQPRPGVLRIATLGGSATMGVGVGWEETYPAQLERLLIERGVGTEVLNAGIEEHSLRQGLELYRQVLRARRPHVLVCSMAGIRACQQAQGMMTDQQKIEGLRDGWLDFGHGQGDGPRDALRLLHLSAWTADLIEGRWWRERELAHFERRLARTVIDIDWPGVRRVPLEEFEEDIRTLVREARSAGTSVVFFTIPRSPSLPAVPALDAYFSSLARVSREERALFVDGRTAFVQAIAADIRPADLFMDDVAPSACGHLLLAQELAGQILAERDRRR